MKIEIKTIALIITVGIFAFSGAIGMADTTTLIKQATSDVNKLFQQRNFKSVKVINELVGLKVEIFLNQNDQPALIAAGKSQVEQDFSGTKDSYKKINGFHFIVTKLENNTTIASGNVDLGLEWTSNDSKFDILKEVLNKLNEEGIIVTIKVVEGDILEITIKQSPIEKKIGNATIKLT